MISRIFAPTQLGITSRLITIECDISNGLPAFLVVGLADKAVAEAKERVRAALRHAKLPIPPKRITMNLAPADMPKDGTSFDMGMAVALLLASGNLMSDMSSKLFAGELGLDGNFRPIRAVLSHAQAALAHGIPELYIPAGNAAEAALCEGITIYAVSSLRELFLHLSGQQPIEPYTAHTKLTDSRLEAEIDFSHVQGQATAKRALEIAAAGGHNILMSGPPGTGKTMLARALAGILPPLNFEELVEVNQIHSIMGLTTNGLVHQRPFRNPHHTSSPVSLIGGGSIPRPGEISLSHRGVLFLDELPEFPRSAIEVLRQPLEDGRVTISRASGSVTYPAKFMLVATQNPCPCGFGGDPEKNCKCTEPQILRYTRKISGPLLDRIDLHVEVGRVKTEELTGKPSGEVSSAIAKRVLTAHQKQMNRLGKAGITNAYLSNQQLQRVCRLTSEASDLARQAMMNFKLSARGYIRLLRVARTIADLDHSSAVEAVHISEALQYRLRTD